MIIFFQPLPVTNPSTNGHIKVIKKRKKPMDNGETKKPRPNHTMPVIAPSHFATAVTSTPEIVVKPPPDCCVCITAAIAQESIK